MDALNAPNGVETIDPRLIESGASNDPVALAIAARVDAVVARPAVEGVATRAAVETVVAGTSLENVVPAAPVESVGTASSAQDVVGGGSAQCVRIGVPDEERRRHNRRSRAAREERCADRRHVHAGKRDESERNEDIRL
jgi:hypothetical protein